MAFAAALVKVLPALIGLITQFIAYANSKQLIDAGAAKETSEALSNALDAIKKADAARADAAKHDAAGGLRDNDGYRRD